MAGAGAAAAAEVTAAAAVAAAATAAEGGVTAAAAAVAVTVAEATGDPAAAAVAAATREQTRGKSAVRQWVKIADTPLRLAAFPAGLIRDLPCVLLLCCFLFPVDFGLQWLPLAFSRLSVALNGWGTRAGCEETRSHVCYTVGACLFFGERRFVCPALYLKVSDGRGWKIERIGIFQFSVDVSGALGVAVYVYPQSRYRWLVWWFGFPMELSEKRYLRGGSMAGYIVETRRLTQARELGSILRYYRARRSVRAPSGGGGVRD